MRRRAALHLESWRSAIKAGAATIQPATNTSFEGGPMALGVAVARIEPLANGTRDREARDRHRVASTGLSPILDVEESPKQWRPPIPADVRDLISDDVPGESAVRSATDSRRVLSWATLSHRRRSRSTRRGGRPRRRNSGHAPRESRPTRSPPPVVRKYSQRSFERPHVAGGSRRS